MYSLELNRLGLVRVLAFLKVKKLTWTHAKGKTGMLVPSDKT